MSFLLQYFAIVQLDGATEPLSQRFNNILQVE